MEVIKKRIPIWRFEKVNIKRKIEDYNWYWRKDLKTRFKKTIQNQEIFPK
jgi:hypothetical protein